PDRDHPGPGELRRERIAGLARGEDPVAAAEQEPEQRPEPGVRPAPLARVAGCGIQQERGHEPVEVADADHPPRLRSARWNRTMRKAWIANAANAVGSAHNAICSGSST